MKRKVLAVILIAVVLFLVLLIISEAQAEEGMETILPIPPGWDCNISFREGLMCDEEIYYVYLPIVFGGNAPPPVVRWENELMEWDYQIWCSEDIECQEWPGIPFQYESPPGYVISFLRLFSYEWGAPSGGYFLYPWEGCIGKVCVDSLEGKIIEKTSIKIVVYIDEDRLGWGEPINLIEICFEMEGFPYKKICDNSYSTKDVVFVAKELGDD